MNIKKYVYVLLSLLFLDLIFNLFAYNTYLGTTILNIVLFDLINAAVICLLTGLFSEKVNRIMTYIIFIILWFWYGLYYVFYKVLVTPFSIALFRQTDQVLKFAKHVIISILQNMPVLLLFFIPILLLIVFRKKIYFEKIKGKWLLGYTLLLVISIGLYIGNIFLQKRETGAIYNLFYETNNISLNIEKLGVMAATYLDVKRCVTGFEDKIQPTIPEDLDDPNDVLYDYNTLNINFDKGNNAVINSFMKNETGSKQNEYTGIFKDKNLVFIVAESFSEIAVSEKYTPTLYKLVHEGFDFENFYTSNNLSTIGGEFQALTGLYADNEILSSWRGGWNYYPYGLGTLFKNAGYNTFAYHDSNAYFQDRNVYLKTQGFDNFKGCNNGLEEVIDCEKWPQSDVEMMEATVNDYINSDKPFMTYYMTVSGHFYYNFNENMMAAKNQEAVADLDYPEEVKGYLATQIELDHALAILMDKLEEAGKLDDTVFVLTADHYPYNLSIKHINVLSSYERDSLIEVNSNNLIIYNSKMKPIKISKVGMSIDILPTILNLFGMKYDSRIIMGKDILGTNEGIAIFKDRSWVTDKGTYYAATGKFVSKDGNIPDGYIDNINAVVSNRVAISKMIVDSNYYKSLFD